IIDTAIAENVDAVLFAGDAFKNRDPSPTLQRMFARRIRRLAEAQIPTVLLAGNHDLPSIMARATAIDIYQALGIPNIHIARNIGVLNLTTRSGPLQIVTLPWVPRNTILTHEALRNLPDDEQLLKFGELISAGVGQRASELDPDIPAVLLGHLSLEGAKLGSEQSIMLGAEVVLTPAEISVDAFTYVALGHIHGHQQVGVIPPVVYAGSVERVDFGEARETKGFVMVDIDRGTNGTWDARWQFRPLPTRPFLTLEFEAANDAPMEQIQRLIERRSPDIEGAIVRMIIKIASEREDEIRVDEIRRWLLNAGAAWVAYVRRDIDAQNRPRVDINDEDALVPEKMLERWLSERDIPTELRERIKAAGLELIQTDRAASTE
ncbi:MAG TPA: exonuclease SbcCD subunit D, partial [Nitrolancea sp.]|nr:exonuclease SbcCD subunit D [Nitrolancea sp.]